MSVCVSLCVSTVSLFVCVPLSLSLCVCLCVWILPDATVLAPEVVQYMLLFSYRKKIPLLGISERQAQKGAVLSLSFGSSNDIGKQAGELSNSILGGKTPAEIPYTTARLVKLTVNLKAARKLEMEIPKSILKIADSIIK